MAGSWYLIYSISILIVLNYSALKNRLPFDGN